MERRTKFLFRRLETRSSLSSSGPVNQTGLNNFEKKLSNAVVISASFAAHYLRQQQPRPSLCTLVNNTFGQLQECIIKFKPFGLNGDNI